MTHPRHASTRVPPADLRARACEIAAEHGFVSDVSARVRAELDGIERANGAVGVSSDVRDLRGLLWSSIDNPESRDLDQVEVCEPVDNGLVRLRLGIADVDHLVPKDSGIDERAAANTTSLYTGVATFPMLPEPLSTDLTSLLESAERLAVVVDLVIDESERFRT